MSNAVSSAWPRIIMANLEIVYRHLTDKQWITLVFLLRRNQSLNCMRNHNLNIWEFWLRDLADGNHSYDSTNISLTLPNVSMSYLLLRQQNSGVRSVLPPASAFHWPQILAPSSLIIMLCSWSFYIKIFLRKHFAGLCWYNMKQCLLALLHTAWFRCCSQSQPLVREISAETRGSCSSAVPPLIVTMTLH